MKKLHLITVLSIVALSASLISIPNSVIQTISAVDQFLGKTTASLVGIPNNLPFNSVVYYNSQYIFPLQFNGIQLLDLSGATAQCSVFNDIHLIDVTGADYKAYNPTNPTFSVSLSLVNPTNNAPLKQVEGRIFFYCTPISTSGKQVGYSPYVAGGNLAMKLTGKTASGATVSIDGTQTSSVQSQQISSTNPSVLLATFRYPASDIQNALGNPPADYIASLNMATSGDVLLQQQAGYFSNSVDNTLVPINSFFSLQNQKSLPPQANCATNQDSLNGQCVSLNQNIGLSTVGLTTFDKSTYSDTIPYQVNLQDFNAISSVTDNYPTVQIFRLPNTSTPIATSNFNQQPSYNGNTGVWSGTISISRDLGGQTGQYQLTLASSTLSDGHQRPSNTIGFTITDSSVSKLPSNVPSTPSTSNNNPPTTIITTVPSSVQISGVKTYFWWQDVYQTGVGFTSDLGSSPPSTTFPVTLTPASLTFSPNGIPSSKGALTYFQIRPMIDTSALSIAAIINSANVIAETIVNICPTTSPNQCTVLSDTTMSNISVGGSGVPFGNMGGGMQQMFPSDLTIQPQDIDNAVSSKGIKVPDGSIVTAKVIVSGTFTISANGNNYKGILSPMTLSEPFTYYNPPTTAPNGPINCSTSSSSATCVPPTPAVCSTDPTKANYSPTCQPNVIGAGICTGLTSDQCAALNAAINNKPNNNPSNGGCNSSTPSVMCTGPAGSTTTNCQNAITGQTSVCQTTQSTTNGNSVSTTSTTGNSNGANNIGAGNQPSGSGVCSTVDTACIAYIQSQITVPVLNQNIIPIAIGGLLLAGVIIYVIWSRKRNAH